MREGNMLEDYYKKRKSDRGLGKMKK